MTRFTIFLGIASPMRLASHGSHESHGRKFGGEFGFRLLTLLTLLSPYLASCDCSFPVLTVGRTIPVVEDASSVQFVWQSGNSIWAQKFDRHCRAKEFEPRLVNQSAPGVAKESYALAGAIWTKAGLAVAFVHPWAASTHVFLKVGDVEIIGAVVSKQNTVDLHETYDGITLTSIYPNNLHTVSTLSQYWSFEDIKNRPFKMPIMWQFDETNFANSWVFARAFQCGNSMWMLAAGVPDGPRLYQYYADDTGQRREVAEYHVEGVLEIALECDKNQVVSIWSSQQEVGCSVWSTDGEVRHHISESQIVVMAAANGNTLSLGCTLSSNFFEFFGAKKQGDVFMKWSS